MKRFTETAKWDDKWFRRLPPAHKLAWQYLCDKCDAAGVIDLDRDLAEFQIGCPVEWDSFLTAAGERIQEIHKDKLWIAGFIKFQYGRLSRDCKPHIPVIQAIERHGMSLEEIEQNEGFKCGCISAGRRAKVFERDDCICCYCGEQFTPAEMEPDHVIPVCRGGTDAMGNLVASCRACNRMKGEQDPVEFIRTTADPGAAWKRLSQRVSERVYETLEETEKDKDKDTDQDKEKDFRGSAEGDGSFAAWWSTVPNKVGKKAAAKAYRLAVKAITGRPSEDGAGGDDPHGFLLERMSAFAASPKARGGFCPHPATWLSEGRYDDDPATWQDAGNHRGANGRQRTFGPGQRFDQAAAKGSSGVLGF